MFQSFSKSSATRIVALSAMAIGVGAGSYGVASAASGSGSTSAGTISAGSTLSQTAATAQPGGAPSGNQGDPWGHQRSDETLLTGDTASKVQAAAVAKVGSGATVARVETDADGNAAYEVHMTKTDGTPITVYVDKSFAVVGVESR